MKLFKLFKKAPQLTWKDITIGQFSAIETIVKNNELNELEKTYRIYTVITGNDGRDVTIARFSKLIEPIKELLSTQLPESKLKKKYVINGITYKPQVDRSVLTTGQYFDYTQLYNSGEYAKILAIFLVPEGHYYNDGEYDLQETIDNISNHLSIVEMNALIFFFKAKVRKYVARFLGSSVITILQTKGVKWKEKKRLIRSTKAMLLNTVSSII